MKIANEEGTDISILNKNFDDFRITFYDYPLSQHYDVVKFEFSFGFASLGHMNLC